MPGRRPHEHVTLPTPLRLSARFPPKVLSFIVEYVLCGIATQAAIRAGYSERSAAQQGNKLLKDPKIQAEIARRTARSLERIDVKTEDVLEQVRRIALADIRHLFDSHGNLRPPAEWTAELQACVASFEIVKKNAVSGDGKIDTIWKLKLWDRVKALELLMRNLNLLNEDKLKVPPPIQITWIAAPGQLPAAPEAVIEATAREAEYAEIGAKGSSAHRMETAQPEPATDEPKEP